MEVKTTIAVVKLASVQDLEIEEMQNTTEVAMKGTHTHKFSISISVCLSICTAATAAASY
jgi:hypothetical protein